MRMDMVDGRPLLKGCALPADGEPLRPATPSLETLDFLARRRSLVAKHLDEPGPSEAELMRLLGLASRVPDHGKLAPWRFIVIDGEARSRLGAALADAFKARQPDAAAPSLDAERNRFTRAPVVVAVISSPVFSAAVPEWEQILSAGAVCHQLLVAANAGGFAAQWLTEWYAYDRTVLRALGLVGGERVAGFIYIGTAKAAAEERRRPDLAGRITRL